MTSFLSLIPRSKSPRSSPALPFYFLCLFVLSPPKQLWLILAASSWLCPLIQSRFYWQSQEHQNEIKISHNTQWPYNPHNREHEKAALCPPAHMAEPRKRAPGHWPCGHRTWPQKYTQQMLNITDVVLDKESKRFLNKKEIYSFDAGI